MKNYIKFSALIAVIIASIAFIVAPFVRAQSTTSPDAANSVHITPVIISLIINDLYQFTFTTSPAAPARLAFGQSSVAVPNPSAHAYGYSSVTEFDVATTTQTVLIRVNRDVVNYFRPVMMVGGTVYFGEETFLSIFHPKVIAQAVAVPVKKKVAAKVTPKAELIIPSLPMVATAVPVIEIDTTKANLSAGAINADTKAGDDVIGSSVRRVWNWITSSICPAN